MKHYIHYQPKEKDKSDFYSWNLFRWLRKENRESPIKKVSIFKTEDGTLFIGARYNDWHNGVTGTRLRQLCGGYSKGKLPDVGLWVGSKDWEDVTEWFWSEYERIGVCAIHGDWAHDFTYLRDSTARMCQHCGKIEKRKVEMVERVTWEPAEC